MLIKTMLTGGGDYGKPLCQRRRAAIGMLAGGTTVFGAILSLFGVLPMDMPAFYALSSVIALYAAVFVLSSLWLSKKL